MKVPNWHEQNRNNFRSKYPKPLLGAIENSCYTKEELAEKLGITMDDFEKKINKEMSWSDSDKSIMCQLLHIPAHYAPDWFGE